MLRPPVLSTLFPYTTLFRSPSQRRIFACWFLFAPDRQNQRGKGSFAAWTDGAAEGTDLLLQHGLLRGVIVNRFLQDRKSTRLNSSHTVISYAVFCLKKKITD